MNSIVHELDIRVELVFYKTVVTIVWFMMMYNFKNINCECKI